MKSYSHNSQNEEGKIRDLFARVFDKDQVICLQGKRKTGKSTFLLELVAQSLLHDKNAEILYVDSLGKFHITQIYRIIASYFPTSPSLQEAIIPRILRRLQICHISFSKDLHKLCSQLETLILKYKNLTMIAIDSLAFYYNDSYEFKRLIGKEITRDMYLKPHIKLFAMIAQKYELSIAIVLADHLLQSETENPIITKTGKKEERNKIKKESNIKPNRNKFKLKSIDEYKETPFFGNIKENTFERYRELKKIESMDIKSDVTITFHRSKINRFLMNINKNDDKYIVQFKVAKQGIVFPKHTKKN